jgi:hypothetical protein
MDIILVPRRTQRRLDILGALLAAALIIVLFLPVVSYGVTQGADFLDHIRDARLWAESGVSLNTAIRPHFLFHLLVIGGHALAGLDYPAAGLAVTLALHALLTVILYVLARQTLELAPVTAAVLSVGVALSLMLASPVTILTWSGHNLYFGYIALHVPHNPTQITLLPFALLFYLGAVRAFLPEKPGSRTVAVTFALGLLSTLSKPSYAICLLPSVGLFTIYRLYRRETVHWLHLLVGIVLPILLVLSWQYLFHRSTLGGFAIDPLRVMAYYSPGLFGLAAKFILSILFPALVTLAYFPAAHRSVPLILAWLAFGIGAGYTYLLREPRDWLSGNFLWSGQISLFILFVAATLFFIRQNIHVKRFDWKFALCGAAFALHIVSGVFWYIIQVTQNIYAWW